MKKVLAIILATVVCFGICACTDKQAEKDKEAELQKRREELAASQELAESLGDLSDLLDQYKNSK
ncbi:MAG: hypothetical protein IJZ15_06910 [Oscillospiraceae bacterium]|nr:hypothetical protein [Oscillospiraceae bacterium]